MTTNQQTRKRGADPTYPRLLGDRLCLDFANSIEGPRGSQPEEFLRDYSDVVRWGRHTGILSEVTVDQLLLESAHLPDEATRVFARALALREAITGVFRSIAASVTPEESDLRLIQTEYLLALEPAHLIPVDDHFEWNWAATGHALDRPLWPIARSAIDVLTTDNLARIKECPGADDCGWLFYDTSKNGSRRWCSMEGCGSRLKMRRQYAKRKVEAAG